MRYLNHNPVVRFTALTLLLLGITAATAAAQSETIEYYGLDALGSVRVIFNAQGAVVDRMDYGPFGENLRAAIKFPVEQFAQIARDAESGQDYAEARNYSPSNGRHNRVDLVYRGLFTPQRWNRYAYARNNPVSFIDPAGLDPFRSTSVPACQTFSCASVAGVIAALGDARSGNDEFEALFDDNPIVDLNTGAGDITAVAVIEIPTPIPPIPPTPTTPDLPAGTEGSPDSVIRTESTAACFARNYGFAWKATNRAFFNGWTRAGRTAVGLITGGAVARNAGLTSPFMAARDLWRGNAFLIMAPAALATSVTASVAVNATVSLAALEVGIAIGSGIDALHQTAIGNCR